MEKKKLIHNVLISILLTLICWQAVDKFIVKITIQQYIPIELILILMSEFRMFVIKNIPEASQKKEEL